jgi:hypothetical protein
MIVDHRPQRRSSVGECEISSVHFSVVDVDGNVHVTLDETCLFWKNGNSRVVGDYGTHDTVVSTLNAARDLGQS